MVQHLSAKQRIRRNERRAGVNRRRMSRIRTFVKKVEVAIESGDRTAAEAALRAAQPELHRGASKGVLHRNIVNRRLSRLSARVRALG
jgi:small subunit ribosomal protein S20